MIAFFFSIYTSVSVQEDLLSIYLLCLLSDVVLQGISALRGTETKKKKKQKKKKKKSQKTNKPQSFHVAQCVRYPTVITAVTQVQSLPSP